MTYLGLFALQHRGQESAGIAVSDGAKIWVYRGMGLVSPIFDDHRLAALRGHWRSATPATPPPARSTWDNAQPVYRECAGLSVRLAHNGNLVNTGDWSANTAWTSAATGQRQRRRRRPPGQELGIAAADDPAGRAGHGSCRGCPVRSRS